MSLTLVGLHVASALIVFLFVLNGFLRSASQQLISLVLLVIQLGLLAAILVTSGWIAALLSLPIVFWVYSAIARPIARPLAGKVLGYRTAFDPMRTEGHTTALPSLEQISKEGQKNRERSARIARSPAIAAVLHRNEMTTSDLYEQLSFLFKAGFGELAWDIVSNPNDLQRLIDLRRQGLSDIEIFARLTRA